MKRYSFECPYCHIKTRVTTTRKNTRYCTCTKCDAKFTVRKEDNKIICVRRKMV